MDVSSSPTVAESKARFMREFNDENGSSIGLRDKKVRYYSYILLDRVLLGYCDPVGTI